MTKALRQLLSENIFKEDVEIEVRFKLGSDSSKFETYKRMFENNSSYQATNKYLCDKFYDDDTRINSEQCIKKTHLAAIHHDKYKISAALETPVSIYDNTERKEVKRRNKQRTSYKYNNIVSYDFTIVDDIFYEIEIDLVNIEKARVMDIDYLTLWFQNCIDDVLNYI